MKKCVVVKRITLMKPKEMLKFDGKNVDKISEPPRHLKKNPPHAVTWNILITVPINNHAMKNFETSLISLKRASLNEQNDSKKLLL